MIHCYHGRALTDGIVAAGHARHPHHDIVGNAGKHHRGLGKDFRLVFLDPKQLWQRAVCLHHMVGSVGRVLGRDLFRDLLRLFVGPRILPDHSPVQRLAVFIYTKTVGIGAVKADTQHILFGNALHQRLGRLAKGRPPVLRILLNPALIGIIGGIFGCCGLYKFALCGKQRRLICAGAEIVGNDIFCHEKNLHT